MAFEEINLVYFNSLFKKDFLLFLGPNLVTLVGFLQVMAALKQQHRAEIHQDLRW